MPGEFHFVSASFCFLYTHSSRRTVQKISLDSDGRRFFKMQVSHSTISNLFGTGIGADPLIDILFPNHQRHPVMDKRDLFTWHSGKNHKMGEPLLKPVQTTEPCNTVTLWLNQVFISGFLLPIWPEVVLPFVIPGCGDYTAVRFPGQLEEGLLPGGL